MKTECDSVTLELSWYPVP